MFYGVWAYLLPREQEQVVGLLVERVDFGAEREMVVIPFRPVGIRSLDEESELAKEALQ